MMLHKTGILFCLWIPTEDNFHVDLTSSNFWYFCLWEMLYFLAPWQMFVCSACLLTVVLKKARTITAALHTFWYIVSFHTSAFFLTWPAIFMLSNACISTETHDIANWLITFCFVSLLVPWAVSWQLLASDSGTFLSPSLSCLLLSCTIVGVVIVIYSAVCVMNTPEA
jgi:hypothetical protein